MIRRFLAAVVAAAFAFAPLAATAQTMTGGGGSVTVPFTAACGSVSVSTVCWGVTETWNNGATVFGAPLQVVVTDMASAAGSLAFSVKGGAAGTTNLFSVDKAGLLYLSGGQTMDGTTANVTVLQNGANPQAFRVVNTTDGTNTEYGQMMWAGNQLKVATGTTGTGTSRAIWVGTIGSQVMILGTGNTDRWLLGTAGHITPNLSNTYDMGDSTHGIRDEWISRHLNSVAGSVPAISACGTTPTLGPGGNDFAGTVTTGTGTPTACTITFGTSYTNAPACVVVDSSGLATLTSYTVGTSAIVLTNAAASSQKIVYHCIGA